MIHKLWGLMVRAVEQLGQAQTRALGGVACSPDPQASLFWEPDREHFAPENWLEPFVHHQLPPLCWSAEPWARVAVGQTHCGWGRQRNRENFGVIPQVGFAGIASERSGKGREGLASSWALEQIVWELAEQRKTSYLCARDWSAACDCCGLERFLKSMTQVHHKLHKMMSQKQGGYGRGVTFAGVHFCGSQAHLIQVGDAQILRWRRGELKVFVAPQSMRLESAWDREQLSVASAREKQPAQSGECFESATSALSSNRAAIGWGNGALLVEAGSVALEHDDIFVMASRGVCDVLSMSVIANVLGQTDTPIEKRMQRLLDIATNTRFQHDDLTLVLLQSEYQPRSVSNETLNRWEGSFEDALFR